jgi:hypothetical protein
MVSQPQTKDKQGCTTRYVGLSYPRVLFKFFGPSSRNAPDKFKGRKEDRRRQKTEEPDKNNKSPNFVWET